MRKSILISSAVAVLALCGTAFAQETVVNDFSGGVTATNHPTTPAYGTWYDAHDDTFGTPSAGTLAGSAAMQIDDGGFTNGVYVIYSAAIPASGFYQLAADIEVVEGGSTSAIGAYQLGAAVGVDAAHRADAPAAALPGVPNAGNLAGLTAGDDSGTSRTVLTNIFSATAGDDLLVAFGTDVETGSWNANAGAWGAGTYVLVDNVRLLQAQEVTVDPSDGTPDNVTTFDSLMTAISSFQVSGNVTAGTDGAGLGTNNGIPGVDIINVVNTGGKVDEVVMISNATALLDDDMVINGQGAIGTLVPLAASTANNSIIAPQDNGGGDYFDIFTDVNLTFNNLTFIPSSTAPGSDDLMRVSRETVGDSVVSYNSCVFTTYDGAGDPIVTSKSDALTSKTASIATPAGDLDEFLYYWPGDSEGLVMNLTDCVFSHTTQDAGNHDAIIELSGDADAAHPMRLNITSTVITFAQRYGIQVSGTGLDADPTAWTMTIGGENAEGGPVAGLGGPSIIAHCDRGVQSFFGSQQGTFNVGEAIIADNTLRQLSLDGDLDLNMDGTLISGPIALVRDAWTASSPTTWDNVTILSDTAIMGDDSPATPTTTITNTVLATYDGNDLFSVLYSGEHSLLMSYTGIGTAEVTATEVTALGAGVFYAAPMFVSTDWTSADFLDVQNTAYAVADSVGGPLAGGADYVGGLTPAAIAVTGAVDFGTQDANATYQDATTQISNTGQSDLQVVLSLSGVDAAVFSVDDPAAAIQTIANGAPLTVTLGFTPNAAAAFSAQLDVANPDISDSVALTGVGVPPSSINDWTILE